ncbi:MAG: PLP-dependent transferase, partial [Eubacterium sp.]|nr:PLP-dependent transferase [Eubacterium sp.]
LKQRNTAKRNCAYNKSAVCNFSLCKNRIRNSLTICEHISPYKCNLYKLKACLGSKQIVLAEKACTSCCLCNIIKLKAAGISGDLIRFSCGIESAEDIIADIEQALEKI